MIHVLAIITAKPGKRDAVLTEFKANMPAVHAEKGCIEYGPAIDAEGIAQTGVGLRQGDLEPAAWLLLHRQRRRFIDTRTNEFDAARFGRPEPEQGAAAWQQARSVST